MAGIGNVVMGARCRLSIKGTAVGYGLQIRVSSGVVYEELRVLGDPYVKERVPQAYTCAATTSRVYLSQNELVVPSADVDSGDGDWVDFTLPNGGTVMPQHGSDSKAFLQNIYKSLQEGITIEVLDASDRIIAHMEDCVLANQDLDFTQGQSTIVNAVFLGKRLITGSETSNA